MEGDSGYFSRRSCDFKFSTATGGSGKIPSPEDLFRLSFDELNASAKYRYFRYGFTDEEDFEDFKRELLDFRKLKRAVRGHLLDDDFSPERGGERVERRFSSSSGGCGGSLESVKVSNTVEVEGAERRDERNHADDSPRLFSPISDSSRLDGHRLDRGGSCHNRESPETESWAGNQDSERNSRRSSGESDPLEPSSQVNTSVSLRGSSGGARAKEGGVHTSKRNGVYFDEECFADDSRPHSKWQRGEARAKQSPPDAEDKSRGKWGEGNSSSGSKNTPDDLVFTEERKGSCGGGGGGGGVRRVSFRETPERFSLDDETLRRSSVDSETSVFSADDGTPKRLPTKDRISSRQNACALKQEPDLLQGTYFARESCMPVFCDVDGVRNIPRKPLSSVDEQIAASRALLESCDKTSLSRQNSISETLSTLNREEEEEEAQHYSQPIELPIRLVSVPVSRYHSTSGLKSFSEEGEQVEESERDPTDREETQKVVSGLPPKAPVSISVRVEKPPTTERGESGAGARSSQNTPTNFSAKQDTKNSSTERVCSGSRAREDIRSGAGKRSDQGHSQTYHPKRSSILESLRRLGSQGRPRSGRGVEPWMEFFSGDEHFQEFERVFETINDHRFSRDLDMRRPGSWWREDGSEKDPNEDDDLEVLHIDEDFLDFFDHDEDFMEFERELANINSNRRSKLLENLHRRSSCDIFTDVKSFCDRSLKRNHTPSSSPKVQRRLSATNSADIELWNSAEEWNLVLNKLRRNSRLLSDQALASGSGGGGYGASGRLGVDSLTRNQTLPASFGDRLHVAGSGLCPRGKDCQYTCHLNCVPSVTLDCTTVSPGSGEGPVATPTDLPSPSELPSPSASAETSLIERRTIVTHRSPQKQQQQQQQRSATPSTDAQPIRASQTVQHLAPPSGTCGRSSSSPDVSLVRDPLSGACVSLTASLSSSTLSTTGAPSSVCVEKDLNQNAKNIDGGLLVGNRQGEDVCDSTNEKDETDSGYRSGTIPDEKLPKTPSQATLNRKERRRKIQTFNHFVPKAALEETEDGESFQGFLRVTLNLIRPITMELGARPPSIYELLTREHIVEQSTQHIAFYMPRDTVKSIHITSKTTTKEVITGLLKKFHILDHPRKFAMYEQEFNEKNKLVKLRRLNDKDFPLFALLSWEPERVKHYRLVLQENETGEIVWDAFSEPELKNFQIVLDREESEAIAQLQYKYRVMKRIILQRMKELRQEKQALKESTA